MNVTSIYKTNTFKIISKEAGEKFKEKLSAEYIDISEKDGEYYLSFSGHDDYYYSKDAEEYDDTEEMFDDMAKHLQEILEKNSYCIIYEIYNEGLRSIDGIVSVITKNEIVVTSLYSFARKTLKQIGVDEKKIVLN